MKTIRYIDFSAQTLAFLLAGLSGFLAIHGQDIGLVLMVQFWLGCWQMLSSAISLILYKGRNRPKLWHFTLALIYLLILCIGALTRIPTDKMFMIFLIVPPWSLAIYYYIITCRETFSRSTKRSSFLTHISF